jgi:FkbM family methyltransferase
MNIMEQYQLEVRAGNYMPLKHWVWPKDDYHCWNYFNFDEKNNYYEKNINGYHLPNDVINLLDKKDLVIQAGGNCGLYPFIYSQHFKNVLTFEPDYRWFACLCMNARGKNISKFQTALGNDNRSVSMETPILKGTDNLGGLYINNGAGSIPKIKIDSLGVDPDLIHLDIEGAEWEALLGAKETINRCKPLIVVEWDKITMQRFGWTTDDVYKLFEDLGYGIVKEWNRDKAFSYLKAT